MLPATVVGMGSPKPFYRRDLPHWQPPGSTLFVTFRQAGSLPEEARRRLAEQRRRWISEPPNDGETHQERAYRLEKRAFAAFDAALNHPACAPGRMRDPAIATLVAEALLSDHRKTYDLLRWVVMPNHVHALLRPLDDDHDASGGHRSLTRILRLIKGRTARAANLAMNGSGPFWQRESWDHWVRDGSELSRIIDYIDRNPVIARLCSSPAGWRWSSARWNR